MPHNRCEKWKMVIMNCCKAMIEILFVKYANTPNKELATMTGMSVGMVQRRAGQLGLKKDPKYLSAVNRKCGMKSSVAKNWKCK